jgi:hypothetical protein
MATMQRTAPSLSFALALLLAQPALARDAREVSWAELAPALVWVKGRMEAQRAVQGARCVDGDASVETSYFMQPALVEPYR